MSAAGFRQSGLIWPTIFAVAGLVVLCGLGTWQLQRMAWKRELLATIAARTASPELTNAGWVQSLCAQAPVAELDRCDYRPVRLTGRFRHQDERHVFIHVSKPHAGVGGTGYWVFVPFELAAPAVGSIYVNRGFVPEAAKTREARGAADAPGNVEIVGLLRRPEPRAWFTGANDVARNIWFLRSPAEFEGGRTSESVSLAAYVDQSGPVAPGRLPVPMAGRVEIANRHFAYALTWFGLAATLAGVYIAFAIGKLRKTT